MSKKAYESCAHDGECALGVCSRAGDNDNFVCCPPGTAIGLDDPAAYWSGLREYCGYLPTGTDCAHNWQCGETNRGWCSPDYKCACYPPSVKPEPTATPPFLAPLEQGGVCPKLRDCSGNAGPRACQGCDMKDAECNEFCDVFDKDGQEPHCCKSWIDSAKPCY